jgi:hypothetical protein
VPVPDFVSRTPTPAGRTRRFGGGGRTARCHRCREASTPPYSTWLGPPLAKGRLERREDGTVVVGMKRAWSDGTTALELSPAELVEKLAALVPPPHANQVIYRGVLAARAAWRREVVPKPPEESLGAAQARRSERLTRRPRIGLAGERASWAELLRRVFGVDAYRCPGCGGRLALRTVVVNPPATTKIMRDLERAQGPP